MFPYYDRFTFRVTFTDLVFTDALTDENSAEYIALSIRVIAAVSIQYCNCNTHSVDNTEVVNKLSVYFNLKSSSLFIIVLSLLFVYKSYETEYKSPTFQKEMANC